MQTRLLAVLLALVVVTASGCAGLSFQQYGSGTQGHTFSLPATRGDAFINLGEPDSVYRAKGTEVLVYKNYQGASYFGIVSKVRRDDTVVVVNGEGDVVRIQEINVGTGLTIFSPIWADATFPIPTKELREAPENYSYDYSTEVTN